MKQQPSPGQARPSVLLPQSNICVNYVVVSTAMHLIDAEISLTVKRQQCVLPFKLPVLSLRIYLYTIEFVSRELSPCMESTISRKSAARGAPATVMSGMLVTLGVSVLVKNSMDYL